MRKILSLTLSFLLFYGPIESLRAEKIHYQLSPQIQFADADHIQNTPFHSQGPIFDERKLAITGMSTFPSLVVFLPLGYILASITRFGLTTTSLERKIVHLNKLTKELSSTKLDILFPYLGGEGIELLFSFLSTEQLVTSSEGKKIYVKCFNKYNQRKKGVSGLLFHDLVDQFIHRFQTNLPANYKEQIKEAQGKEYEEDIDRFLNHLGFVTWSDQTLSLLNIGEDELYEKIYDLGIIDRDYSLSVKKSATNIDQVLSRKGFNNKEHRKSVLHDLGLLHQDDLNIIKNALSHTEAEELKKEVHPTYFSLLSQNREQFVSHLEDLLETPPANDLELKKIIELSLLRSVLTKEEIAHFKSRHQLNSKFHLPDDEFMVLKLILTEKISPTGEYHLFQLDHDLQKTMGFIIQLLDKMSINNDLYRIMSLPKEEIALSSMSYILGFGFMSIGVLRFTLLVMNCMLQTKINSAVIMAQKATATAALAQEQAALSSPNAPTTAELAQKQADKAVNKAEKAAEMAESVRTVAFITNGVVIGAGVLNILVNSIQFTQNFLAIMRLRNSQKVSLLIDEHLKQQLKNPILTPQEKSSLTILRFNATADYFLKKIEKTAKINSAIYNSFWVVFGSLGIISGTSGIMALLGIAAAITISSIVGTISSAYLGLIIIPAMLLIQRTRSLQQKVNFTTQTVLEFKRALAIPSPQLEAKHQQFLKIFFENSEETLKFALRKTEIEYNQKRISEKDTVEGIESSLSNLYHARRKAILHWKKILQTSPETKEMVKELIHSEMDRQKIDQDLSKFKNPIPTYYRSWVDFLLECFDPGVSQSVTAPFITEHPMPDSTNDYIRDQVLSKLFATSYIVYKNVRGNIFDYIYLTHKKELQEKFFKMPLSQREQNLIIKRFKKRHNEIDCVLDSFNLNTFVSSLQEMHPQYPLHKVPWNNYYVDQLLDLVDYSKAQVELIRHIREDQGVTTELPKLPDISYIEMLINHFMPLSSLEKPVLPIAH